MIISSVQSLSHVQPFVTPWTATCQASCPSTPELAQTHVHRVGDAIHGFILCRLLLLLPSIFPSIRVFPNESVLHISSVQSLSLVQLFSTPWTAAHQASLSITNSQSLFKLTSIELVMPSNHLILCRPPPAFNLSQHQGLFQWVSSSHQMAKVLEFSFSISPSNEYSGVISFRIDWLNLLAVRGTLKSLLQHHSLKLWHFSIVFVC